MGNLGALETFIVSNLDALPGWNNTLGKERGLVLHSVTREFHHKGQALAIARALGHPHSGKPDTDLVDP